MATSAETRVVNAAGVVQGIALVTFHAVGVGPLRDAGVKRSTVYALAAIVAVAMCGWSFLVAGRRSSSASVALPGSGRR